MRAQALSLAFFAGALCGCAHADRVVGAAADYAASQGRLSQKQADSIKKTSTAFRKSAEEISESEEYFIGRAVAAQLLGRYPPLKDPQLNRYVQAVAQVVAMSSDRPVIYKGYHVQVMDSPEVNAFAAPGGFLFVTKGLLRLVESEDQLACILAHELAHVSRKHGLKTIKTARLTQAFMVLGAETARNLSREDSDKLAVAFSGAIGDIVSELVVNGYSQEAEFEADQYGGFYAQRSAYDPRALTKFLSKMDDAGGNGRGMYKTHPGAEERRQELAQYRYTPSPAYKRSPVREKRFEKALEKL
jgi:predicted Zn-dependent protease